MTNINNINKINKILKDKHKKGFLNRVYGNLSQRLQSTKVSKEILTENKDTRLSPENKKKLKIFNDVLADIIKKSNKSIDKHCKTKENCKSKKGTQSIELYNLSVGLLEKIRKEKGLKRYNNIKKEGNNKKKEFRKNINKVLKPTPKEKKSLNSLNYNKISKIRNAYDKILRGRLKETNNDSSFENGTDYLFKRILENVDNFEDKQINEKIRELEKEFWEKQQTQRRKQEENQRRKQENQRRKQENQRRKQENRRIKQENQRLQNNALSSAVKMFNNATNKEEIKQNMYNTVKRNLTNRNINLNELEREKESINRQELITNYQKKILKEIINNKIKKKLLNIEKKKYLQQLNKVINFTNNKEDLKELSKNISNTKKLTLNQKIQLLEKIKNKTGENFFLPTEEPRLLKQKKKKKKKRNPVIINN